jgi:hypothetical protein
MSNDRTHRTHPVNVAHLVVGLVFLGIAGSWALREAELVDAGEARWALPLILVLAGLVGLVAAVAKSSGRAAGHDAGHSTWNDTGNDTWNDAGNDTGIDTGDPGPGTGELPPRL